MRWLPDENFHNAIVRGLRRRDPAFDVIRTQDAGLVGSEDLVLLAWSAEQGRVPPPSRLKRGQRLVPVPLWIAGKLALYLAMREQGISNSALARRL